MTQRRRHVRHPSRFGRSGFCGPPSSVFDLSAHLSQIAPIEPREPFLLISQSGVAVPTRDANGESMMIRDGCYQLGAREQLDRGTPKAHAVEPAVRALWGDRVRKLGDVARL